MSCNTVRMAFPKEQMTMVHSKIFTLTGLLAPLLIAPCVAFLGSIDLRTLFMLEHGSGSLLVSSGLLVFLLLSQFGGKEDRRSIAVGSLLLIFGVGAFVVRGGLLHRIITATTPGQGGLSGGRVAVVVVCYVCLVVCYIRSVLPVSKVPDRATHVVAWSELD